MNFLSKIKKWVDRIDCESPPKCYICSRPGGDLKAVQSHVLVCGYYGEFHPIYHFHSHCLKKALNLEDGFYTHSQVDKAIEIVESIKMWKDKKTAALEIIQDLGINDI